MFVNICKRFLALEGVIRLSARIFLEYIFCSFEKRSEGQFLREKFSFLSGLLAITK